MATVAQVAKAALQKILVQGSEAEFEPDEYQDFVFALNAFMTDLDARGVALGYTEVSDLSDEVTVPTGALRGVIYNMALEVAPDYSGVVTDELRRIAAKSMGTMELIGQTIPTTNYPSTLPVGSGNEPSAQYSHYYEGDETAILAETTGAIAVETGT